ncbi:Mitochondrial substrate carrier family protein X [Galdieria sulphuraria]|nr:Mitochondrial substrate carrier family protein X [Galdieria sulphuraria]
MSNNMEAIDNRDNNNQEKNLMLYMTVHVNHQFNSQLNEYICRLWSLSVYLRNLKSNLLFKHFHKIYFLVEWQEYHSTHSSSSSSRSLKGVTNILSVHHQWRVGAVVRSILGREEKAIKLSVNDMLCSFLSDEQGKTSLMNSIIAGAGAGFCQVIATCPMEMLMITFQTRSSQGQPIHSVTQLVKELGIRGIYKGLIATLCRDVPFSSSERLAIPYVFVSGIGAGCLAAVLSTPMDVIKTRLQSSHSPYRGIVDCFVRTLHEDGITKFFSGSIARACIVSPLFGIALLFYEFQKRLASPS